MKLNTLAMHKIPWIEHGEIVISSRIRLARNIPGVQFPSKADKSTQVNVFDTLVAVIPEVAELRNAQVLRLNDFDKIDRRLLMERHLISHELAVKTNGEPGLVYKNTEEVSIMINEEDHYRLQIITPELSLKKSWETLSKIDDELNAKLNFSFHKRFGYLTACPTNVGTGIRVSCLLHLPALAMTENIDKLVNGLTKVNVSVRGFYGEGSQPLGDIFQISNSVTLGKTENEIIESFIKVIHTVSKYEQEAREKLLQKEARHKIEDRIHRAYGILSYAKTIDSEEAILHLTSLKLANELNIELNFDKDQIDQLIFIIQPGHLQQIQNSELNSQQRDIARADIIRKRLFH
ncbi:MAG: protein arginine kinase [Elusimicrobia bacterium RIFOXYA2_FULL_39_19]|nr:MAG: protein arginine kinase [Elusimicrobia bacterium RIFOXYA2_FULL_39_19]